MTAQEARPKPTAVPRERLALEVTGKHLAIRGLVRVQTLDSHGAGPRCPGAAPAASGL